MSICLSERIKMVLLWIAMLTLILFLPISSCKKPTDVESKNTTDTLIIHDTIHVKDSTPLSALVGTQWKISSNSSNDVIKITTSKLELYWVHWDYPYNTNGCKFSQYFDYRIVGDTVFLDVGYNHLAEKYWRIKDTLFHKYLNATDTTIERYRPDNGVLPMDECYVPEWDPKNFVITETIDTAIPGKFYNEGDTINITIAYNFTSRILAKGIATSLAILSQCGLYNPQILRPIVGFSTLSDTAVFTISLSNFESCSDSTGCYYKLQIGTFYKYENNSSSFVPNYGPIPRYPKNCTALGK